MTTIGDVLSGQAQWVVLDADCSEVLPMLPPKSVAHVITDPPFSEHVHSRQQRQRFDGAGVFRMASLGFGHVTPAILRTCGVHIARIVDRWIIIKADDSTRERWQSELVRGGARHVRTGVWEKIGAQPQLSGDRPAVGHECLEIAHAGRQRMRWNSGGKHAIWRHPVARIERVHPTQTPVSLWIELLEDFTDPGDLVLDPFCGSGSLGIACVRLGRRYIGIDNGKDASGKPWAQFAREGIEAEQQGLSRGAARAGQLGLFGTTGTR